VLYEGPRKFFKFGCSVGSFLLFDNVFARNLRINFSEERYLKWKERYGRWNQVGKEKVLLRGNLGDSHWTILEVLVLFLIFYSVEQYESEKSYLGKQVEAKVILSLIMSMKSDKKESSLNIVSV